MTRPTALNQPLTLPCGVVLPNRIAKAPMSEHQAERDMTPGKRLWRLYDTWSRGGAGLLISGNVMVDFDHAESFRNVVVDKSTDLGGFERLATVGQVGGNHFWVQLNHAGRQTPSHVNQAPLAPSAVEPVNVFRKANAFGMPRAMSEADIEDVISRFGFAAGVVQRSGFSGVQVHAAHGYLASQFLSPLTNHRTDAWGGSLKNRARFVRSVITAIRDAVGPDFPVSVKLNSADFQRGGMTQQESLQVLAMLQDDGVDLIEVSGGSYESTAMFDGTDDDKSSPTKSREAYFLDYARAASEQMSVPLMLTGGMRSVSVMEDAVASGAVDVVGMARPFTHNPAVAREILEGQLDYAQAPPPVPGLARLGGVAESVSSQVQISLICHGRNPASDLNRTLETAVMIAKEVWSLRRQSVSR